MKKCTTAKILNWYMHGETGVSSEAIASVVMGEPPVNIGHPSDPADFYRCIKFLEAVPEARSYMSEVAKLSPQWKSLVKRWDEIENCFIDEVGYDCCKSNSAPETYELMKNILYHEVNQKGGSDE